MLLLCFVLDLRSLSPPVLRDLKQITHNYFVDEADLSSTNNMTFSTVPVVVAACKLLCSFVPKINNSSDSTHSTAKPLLDCIGLCYVLRNRTSCSDELKIAYTPQGNFNLHDFHHALNSLPTDASCLNNDSCFNCDYEMCITVIFYFKQTCRCHGIPLDHANVNQTKRSSSCPVTNDDLGALDIIENSVRRTNLGSLSEGLIMGPTYFVTPSTLHDSDENDKSEGNNQLFQAVCSVLNSLDQGLVCSSNCNIETAVEISFRCYYILLPSDKGLMLLRLEVSDYNPVQHERGLHQKLNLLVKESLQFGAILPKSKEGISSSNSNLRSPEAQPPMEAAGTVVVPVDEPPPFDPKPVEKKGGPCLTEEWEQLVVTELKGIHSPTCISNLKLDQVVTSPSQSNRQVDEKTSRILERLELPRQLKRKAVSPTMSITLSAPAKKPLIPYKPTDTADQGPVLSQPIKPNFQRIKKGRDTKANHMR
ncbi:UNVERIFIED_CONTAM: hypothetical protein Scaly_0167000 [Sesamum calycinum]|uniref:Uncharacterized protein n=1 Tax=Sesamum calycinum TaxID=2727403 RepID=A0AAW2T054_9LAMI